LARPDLARIVLESAHGGIEMRNHQIERSEGKAEKLGGKLKKGIGRIIGNERMQVEGLAKEIRGKTREENAKSSERAKGKAEALTGALKNRVGHVIGNERMAAEGKVKELKGEARQKANR